MWRPLKKIKSIHKSMNVKIYKKNYKNEDINNKYK